MTPTKQMQVMSEIFRNLASLLHYHGIPIWQICMTLTGTDEWLLDQAHNWKLENDLPTIPDLIPAIFEAGEEIRKNPLHPYSDLIESLATEILTQIKGDRKCPENPQR